MNPELIKAVAVTAELTGTELSDAAKRMIVEELSAYPEQQVERALAKCRRELKHRLTLADIIERLDDGHPGPNEAWALVPRSEAETVCWTEQACQAFYVAAFDLLNAGDPIAARMAFMETYKRLVSEARERREKPHWALSLGHDKQGRAVVVEQAVRQKRISAEHALRLMPPDEPLAQNIRLLAAGTMKQIAHEGG